MATTTNYGWETPDDTDLVKDGAAAIRTLGNSVDTTTKNLNPQTTLGDLAYRSATANVNTRLALGTANQVLRVNSGGTAPEWATSADVTPLTTKGDLFTFTTADARLGVGANNTVLTADSAEATGLKWATVSAGAYTLLSTTNLSSTETSITGISGDYQNLVIVIQDHFLSAGQNIRYKFNTDATANNYRGLYDYVLFGGSPASNTSYFTEPNIPDCSNEQTTTADQDRISIVTIFNYATASSTKLFTVQTKNRNSSNEYAFGAGWGYWGNTGQNAVTSFQVTTYTGTPTFSGGTVKIYGVK